MSGDFVRYFVQAFRTFALCLLGCVLCGVVCRDMLFKQFGRLLGVVWGCVLYGVVCRDILFKYFGRSLVVSPVVALTPGRQSGLSRVVRQ